MSIGQGWAAAGGGRAASERSSLSSSSSSSSDELLELLLLEVEESLSSEDEEFPWCSNPDGPVTAAGPRLNLRIATAVAAVASRLARVASQKGLQPCKEPQSTLHRQGGCI